MSKSNDDWFWLNAEHEHNRKVYGEIQDKKIEEWAERVSEKHAIKQAYRRQKLEEKETWPEWKKKLDAFFTWVVVALCILCIPVCLYFENCY